MTIFPDPAPLLAAQLVSILNHLLSGQPWLRQRLVPFAGRSAEFVLVPAKLSVTIGPEGQLVPASTDAGADASVHVPVSAALQLAAGDRRARSRIEVSGDAAFAAALAGVLQELRWDVEEDLSRVVGDIAAHRVVAAGRSLLDWQRQAADSFMHACAEFLTEERPVLAPRLEVERWVHEVDLLREAAERLEKRIAQLEKHGAQLDKRMARLASSRPG